MPRPIQQHITLIQPGTILVNDSWIRIGTILTILDRGGPFRVGRVVRVLAKQRTSPQLCSSLSGV